MPELPLDTALDRVVRFMDAWRNHLDTADATPGHFVFEPDRFDSDGIDLRDLFILVAAIEGSRGEAGRFVALAENAISGWRAANVRQREMLDRLLAERNQIERIAKHARTHQTKSDIIDSIMSVLEGNQ